MKNTSLSKSTLGSSFIILSSLFYASYGIWSALIGKYTGGNTASAVRSVLVLIILIPAGLLRHEFRQWNIGKNWHKLAGLIAVSSVIWGLLYYSVLNAGVGVSLTVLYAAITIGMVFFGWLLAGEKLTRSNIISVAIGIVGLTLIFLPTLSDNGIKLLPLLAALISGFATAANNVLAKELPYGTTQRTSAVWITSVMANVPMMFLLNESFPKIEFHVVWLYLIAFAVCSILASWMLQKGMEYIEAGLAGILGLLEVVFGILFGIIFFNETIGPLLMIGAAIIVFASAFPYLSSLPKHNK